MASAYIKIGTCGCWVCITAETPWQTLLRSVLVSFLQVDTFPHISFSVLIGTALFKWRGRQSPYSRHMCIPSHPSWVHRHWVWPKNELPLAQWCPSLPSFLAPSLPRAQCARHWACLLEDRLNEPSLRYNLAVTLLIVKFRFENLSKRSIRSPLSRPTTNCPLGGENKFFQSKRNLVNHALLIRERQTRCLSFHGLREGFPLGHPDCKWPVLWDLTLYLQWSPVWFVRSQRWHRLLSPAGWSDFLSLSWRLPRFEKRLSDGFLECRVSWQEFLLDMLWTQSTNKTMA